MTESVSSQADIDSFLEIYGEFDSEDEEQISWALRLAGYRISRSIDETRRKDALFLLAAHLLERRRTQVAESATRLASVAEGSVINPVSVSTNPTSKDILMLTAYGQEYLALINIIRPVHSFGLNT